MTYQANPVIVSAFRIIGTKEPLASGHVGLVLEGDNWHLATPEQLSRISPQPGDYVVVQADGYIYLNPRDVFERKYSKVDPKNL